MEDDVDVVDQLKQKVEMNALGERNPAQSQQPEKQSRQIKGGQQLSTNSSEAKCSASDSAVFDMNGDTGSVPIQIFSGDGHRISNREEVNACFPSNGKTTDQNKKLSTVLKRDPSAHNVEEEAKIEQQGYVADSVADVLMLEKNYSLLRDNSGNSFEDYLALSTGHDRGAAITETEERRLLVQWLNTEVDAKQIDVLQKDYARNLKRSRECNFDSKSQKPTKSARLAPGHNPVPADSPPGILRTGRRRYSIAGLLELRHGRKNESLNKYSFSKSCALPDAVVVSNVDKLAIGADGRLRSTDVLLPVVQATAPATFASMMLPNAVVDGLRKAGFTTPSPVQYRGIPVGRLGTDLVAQAKSGTGKTVVFAVLIAEIVLKAPPGQVVALVLAPTREIARQIAHVVRTVLPNEVMKTRGKNGGKNTGKQDAKREGKNNGRSVALLVGGTPERKDKEALRVARVAIGTPGRVRALLERGTFNGASVKMLVLDEADRLMDTSAGFALGALVGCLGEQRQTLAFSATYTPKLVARLRKIMRSPQLIWLGDERVAGTDDDSTMHRGAVLQAVTQFQVNVRGYGVKAKANVFVRMLSVQEFTGCIAFAGQRDAVEHYANRARKAGFTAKYVSAGLNERKRRTVLEEFESGTINVLVCTDLLARGVSFEKCDFVVQLDVAHNTETHLHRVGRAGRFGTTGMSVVVVDEGQRGEMREIERDIGGLSEWPHAKEISRNEITPTGTPFVRVNADKIQPEKNLSDTVEGDFGIEKADVEDNATQEARGKCSYDMHNGHGSWENAIPEPQNAKSRGGNMSSTRALGFAHGYSRARDVIFRLSSANQ